jgi:hypothetical protein
MSMSVDKLFSDTVYGIQKDVLKVALLAAASMVYGAAKDGRLHTLLTPMGLLIAGAFVAARAQRSRQPDGDDATMPLPGVAGDLLSNRYVSAALVLATVVVIDYLDLNRQLAHQMRQFLGIVAPRLKAMLHTGKPVAQPPRGGLRLWAPWLIPSAIVGRILLILRRAHVARALLEVELLPSQNPLALRWRALMRSRHQWQPLLEKTLEVMGAVFGTGSAIKYLMRK